MTESVNLKNTEEGVFELALNRVPVNALNTELLDTLGAHLAELGQAPEVKVIVLSSALKVFSAGLDLKEAQAFSVSDQTAIVDGLNATLNQLYGMSKPVIAAVNGAAIAGGLFFVLASDYSIARSGAKFGLTEVRVGVNFPIAPLEIARASLAPNVFRKMLLGGKNVDSSTALDMGLIDEVVADDDLLPRVYEVAKDYASIPPQAFARIKTQMRATTLATIGDAIEQESDPTRPNWFSDETARAMKALLSAKR